MAERFGDALADIMRRRYIAAIDVARALGVSPEQVRRWLRGEAAPNAEDVATLVHLLDSTNGADGTRLRRAADSCPPDRVPSEPEPEPEPGSESQAPLAVIPEAFRHAFATPDADPDRAPDDPAAPR